MSDLVLTAKMLYTAAAILTGTSEVETECVAKTIYYEARGESLGGQQLVGVVVNHRSARFNYPTSLCGVVTEARRVGLYKCQFTAWCDGKREDPRDNESLLRAVAATVISSWTYKFYPSITHYHSSTVSPSWAQWDRLTLFSEVDGHLFYMESL